MKTAKRIAVWSVLTTGLLVFFACPPNSLLTDVQSQVQEAQANSIQTVSTPTFSPTTGAFSLDQTVTIADATPGATIYYTSAMGGAMPADPSATSAVFNAPITVSGNNTITTIKAIAIKAGMKDSAIAPAIYTISYDQVSNPTFSPTTGTYFTDQKITINETTPGATIHYTAAVNGVPLDPTSASPSYGVPIQVSENNTTITIKALASKAEMVDSAIITATFTIRNDQVSTPQFSLPFADFVYSGSHPVTISTSTDGASIHYTIDGSPPTASYGMAYNGPFSVAATVKIIAIAYKDGMNDSTQQIANYTFQDAMPTYSPPSQTYTSAQIVTINTTMPGASIRYTTDGSDPSISATSTSGPSGLAVNVEVSETIRAIAYEDGWTAPPSTAASYTLQATAPTFTPPADTYSGAQSVTISTTTPGEASIRYTSNGSIPSSTSGTIYTVPVTVGTTETLQAIACKSGWANSVVTAAAYMINYTIAFNKNDSLATGSMAAQTIANGSSANLTANAFTKTGWTFAGWATTSGGSVAYTNLANYTMGVGNVTLYAKWTVNSYTVAYNGNGSTGGTLPTTTPHNYGSTVTVASNSGKLIKINVGGFSYRLGSWNTQADGNGTNYTLGSGTFTMGPSNVTLYAKWVPYALRDTGPAGGLIFYDSGSYSGSPPWRYIEAAPSDQSAGIQWWAGSLISFGTVGTTVGSGFNNTMWIVGYQGTSATYAARTCLDLSLGGYSNCWFLPSKDELYWMYQNLKVQGVGGFASAWYWSSSNVNGNNGGAWWRNFSTGSEDTSIATVPCYVRAARYF